jgi:hypothetical protein
MILARIFSRAFSINNRRLFVDDVRVLLTHSQHDAVKQS